MEARISGRSEAISFWEKKEAVSRGPRARRGRSLVGALSLLIIEPTKILSELH